MNGWSASKKWVRRYHKFAVEVSQHSFRERGGYWELPHIWNTYILIGDGIRFSREVDGKLELCDKYAEPNPLVDRFWKSIEAMHSLPWNGGITLEQRTVCPTTGLRTLKVGDDYSHSWDTENRRFEMYDLDFMMRQASRLADEFEELVSAKGNS